MTKKNDTLFATASNFQSSGPLCWTCWDCWLNITKTKYIKLFKDMMLVPFQLNHSYYSTVQFRSHQRIQLSNKSGQPEYVAAYSCKNEANLDDSFIRWSCHENIDENWHNYAYKSPNSGHNTDGDTCLSHFFCLFNIIFIQQSKIFSAKFLLIKDQQTAE